MDLLIMTAKNLQKNIAEFNFIDKFYDNNI